MDIDGILRCPKCLSAYGGDHCDSCGHTEGEAPVLPGCLEGETILNDRYLIGAVIGSGGFGVTYAAWDLTLNQPVAIKEYFPRSIATRDTSQSDDVSVSGEEKSAALFEIGRKRFIREARMLALLDATPGVVCVWDMFEANQTAYLVMEFVRGVSLKSYAEKKGGVVEPDKLLAMMRGPIEALAAVHKAGLLHRDVSPANLMLEPGGQLKLIDFGAATDLQKDGFAADATMILNRGYAAPEQHQAGGQLGAWTDVYGVCATIFALLTGKKPDEDAHVLNPKVGLLKQVRLPRKKRKAIERGLNPHWKNRIKSMPELLSALYGVPLPEELAKQKRLIRIAVISICSTVLLTLLLLANAFLGIPTGAGMYLSLGQGGFSVLRYTGGDQSPKIPTHFLAIPVRRIGQAAFRDCAGLRALVVPEGIKSLGDWAFYGCADLAEARLPQSVEHIDNSAFDQCGENLVIYGSAGSEAERFAQSNALPFVDPAQFEYTHAEGGLMVTHYNGTARELVVPQEIDGQPVTSVDFSGGMYSDYHDITKVRLPDSVRAIELNGFSGFFSLNEIQLPDRLESIDVGAFSGLSQLKELQFPEGVKEIGYQAFYRCTRLTSVDLPKSLVRLGFEAFGDCAMLEALHLPDALETIEYYAFGGCANLETVYLPKALKVIESSAFMNCTSIEEIVIPEGTASIAGFAFSGCAALSSAVIPPSVTWIGDLAFAGCSRDLIIYGASGSAAEAYAAKYGIYFDAMDKWTPESDFDYEIDESGQLCLSGYHGASMDVVMPSYIAGKRVSMLLETESAFFEYSGEVIDAVHQLKPIRSAVLPQSVASVPDSFFAGCSKLESVVLPRGLKRIDSYAFHGCESLSSLALPDALRAMGGMVFGECRALKALTIPGSDPALGAFLQSSNVEVVRFGEGTTYIGRWFGYGDAPMLRRVYIPASVSYIEPEAFAQGMAPEDQPEDEQAPVTLVVEEGSYAQSYAREHGMPFEIA